MDTAYFLTPPLDYIEVPADTTLPIVHGALMATVWILLVPLAVITARHKWLFGDAEFLTKKLWFLAHVTLQLTAVAAFIPAIVIALSQSALAIVSTDPPLNLVHKGLGITTLVLTGLQVIIAFIRPTPDAPNRKYWNLIHHNLGRLLILTAWAAVYTGIKAYVNNVDDTVQNRWLTPIVVVNGSMVLAFVIFEFASIIRVSRMSSKSKVYEATAENSHDASVCMKTLDLEMNVPKLQQGMQDAPTAPRDT